MGSKASRPATLQGCSSYITKRTIQNLTKKAWIYWASHKPILLSISGKLCSQSSRASVAGALWSNFPAATSKCWTSRDNFGWGFSRSDSGHLGRLLMFVAWFTCFVEPWKIVICSGLWCFEALTTISVAQNLAKNSEAMLPFSCNKWFSDGTTRFLRFSSGFRSSTYKTGRQNDVRLFEALSMLLHVISEESLAELKNQIRGLALISPWLDLSCGSHTYASWTCLACTNIGCLCLWRVCVLFALSIE